MGRQMVMLVMMVALSFIPVRQQDITEEKNADMVEMMAVCVEAEAGNQGFRGKQLVADMILNRVDSDRFPNDIESVIKQKNQFSSYFDGGMAKAIPSEETYRAVRTELMGKRVDSSILFFTAGAYNKYCVPAYKYKDHYFGR